MLFDVLPLYNTLFPSISNLPLPPASCAAVFDHSCFDTQHAKRTRSNQGTAGDSQMPLLYFPSPRDQPNHPFRSARRRRALQKAAILGGLQKRPRMPRLRPHLRPKLVLPFTRICCFKLAYFGLEACLQQCTREHSMPIDASRMHSRDCWSRGNG